MADNSNSSSNNIQNLKQQLYERLMDDCVKKIVDSNEGVEYSTETVQSIIDQFGPQIQYLVNRLVAEQEQKEAFVNNIMSEASKVSRLASIAQKFAQEVPKDDLKNLPHPEFIKPQPQQSSDEVFKKLEERLSKDPSLQSNETVAKNLTSPDPEIEEEYEKEFLRRQHVDTSDLDNSNKPEATQNPKNATTEQNNSKNPPIKPVQPLNTIPTTSPQTPSNSQKASESPKINPSKVNNQTDPTNPNTSNQPINPKSKASNNTNQPPNATTKKSRSTSRHTPKPLNYQDFYNRDPNKKDLTVKTDDIDNIKPNNLGTIGEKALINSLPGASLISPSEGKQEGLGGVGKGKMKSFGLYTQDGQQVQIGGKTVLPGFEGTSNRDVTALVAKSAKNTVRGAGNLVIDAGQNLQNTGSKIQNFGQKLAQSGKTETGEDKAGLGNSAKRLLGGALDKVSQIPTSAGDALNMLGDNLKRQVAMAVAQATVALMPWIAGILAFLLGATLLMMLLILIWCKMMENPVGQAVAWATNVPEEMRKVCKGLGFDICETGSTGGNAGTLNEGAGVDGISCLTIDRTGKYGDPYLRAIARATGSCGVESPCGGDEYVGFGGAGNKYFGRYQYGFPPRASNSWDDDRNLTGNQSLPDAKEMSTAAEASERTKQLDVKYKYAQDKLFMDVASTKTVRGNGVALMEALKTEDVSKIAVALDSFCNQWNAMCSESTPGGKASTIAARFIKLLAEEKTGSCGSSSRVGSSNLAVSTYPTVTNKTSLTSTLFGGVEVEAAEVDIPEERARLADLMEKGYIRSQDKTGISDVKNGALKGNVVKVLLFLYDSGYTFVTGTNNVRDAGTLTASGNISDHTKGTAMDITDVKKRDGNDVAINKGSPGVHDLRTTNPEGRQIIKDFAALLKGVNILKPTQFLGPSYLAGIADQTPADHQDHIHFAVIEDKEFTGSAGGGGGGGSYDKCGCSEVSSSSGGTAVDVNLDNICDSAREFLYPFMANQVMHETSIKITFNGDQAMVDYNNQNNIGTKCNNFGNVVPSYLSVLDTKFGKDSYQLNNENCKGAADSGGSGKKQYYLYLRDKEVGTFYYMYYVARNLTDTSSNNIYSSSKTIGEWLRLYCNDCGSYYSDVLKGVKLNGHEVNENTSMSDIRQALNCVTISKLERDEMLNGFFGFSLHFGRDADRFASLQKGKQTTDIKPQKSNLWAKAWGDVNVEAKTGSRPTSYSEITDKYKEFLSQIAKERGYTAYPDKGGENTGMKKAFNDMVSEASKSGISLNIVSSYRSYDDQVSTFFSAPANGINEPIQHFWSPDATADELKTIKADYLARARWSAPPGFSEHSTGLAIDINKADISFENEPAFTWLKTNASKFGFVLSYPKGVENKGAGYEPWHWRWDGNDKYPNPEPVSKLAGQGSGGGSSNTTSSGGSNPNCPSSTSGTKKLIPQNLDSSILGKAMTQIPQNTTALTFDDAPQEPYTSQVLDALKANDMHATFFVVGEQIAGNEALLQRICSEGNELANHSYTHPNFFQLTDEQIRDEISKTTDAIKKAAPACADKIVWMRFPFGNGSQVGDQPRYQKIANELGLSTVYWTTDTNDWNKNTPQESITNTVANSKQQIVLMHVGASGDIPNANLTKDRSKSVKAIQDGLPKMKANGVKSVTLSEAFPPKYEYIGGGGGGGNFSGGSVALLNYAKKQSAIINSTGLCLMHVENYIDAIGFGKMGGKNGPIPSHGEAYQFADWLNANNGAVAKKYGIKNLLWENPNLTPYDAPAGSIVVVSAHNPGTCHNTAGDISVAGGDGTFYNDHPTQSYGGKACWNGSQSLGESKPECRTTCPNNRGKYGGKLLGIFVES